VAEGEGVNRTLQARVQPLLLIALGALAGCASNGTGATSYADADGPTGVWSPHARARFITLTRSTTYAIVREEDTDLLVLEEGIDGARFDGPDRFVWIVSIPTGAEFEQPVELGAEAPSAWLLEYRAGRSTHAQPATGRVTVLGRTESTLSAQVDLVAPGAPRAPGQLTSNDVTLAARLDLPRYQPIIPGSDDPSTRSGVDGLRDPNPEPRSVYGAR